MSADGLNDVTKRPKVGMVHRTAMRTAVIEAPGELNRSRLREAFRATRPSFFLGPAGGAPVASPGSLVENAWGGVGVVLIGSPPRCASAGRCRRRSGSPGRTGSVSYTHLRAHETRHDLVCRLL